MHTDGEVIHSEEMEQGDESPKGVGEGGVRDAGFNAQLKVSQRGRCVRC